MLATVAVAGAAISGAAFAQDWKLSGDVRYRFENVDDETADARTRERLRARVGVTGTVSDALSLHFGAATGSLTDPVSTNQTLDDAACKKGFNLDYAYAAWKPGDIGLKVLAGKMQNPFVMPAGSSLVWDSDLTPEGLAATWQMPGDAAMKPFATLSHHWVDERYAGGVDGVDATMLGLQLGVKSKVLTAGLGMFRFENMAGFAPIANGAEGNSLSGGNYATEFGEFEVFAEVRPDVGAPLVIGVDFVTNLEADALNTGYLVRVAYGKLKEPGSFTVAIDYRSLEADCVLGTWTDSDHFDGGTNGTGLGLSAAVQIDENASLAVTYLMDTKDPEGAATSYNRLQVDLSYKF